MKEARYQFGFRCLKVNAVSEYSIYWTPKFILTGSAQLDLIERVTQSLAGRASVLELLPFSKSELDQAGKRYDFENFEAVDWYYDYYNSLAIQKKHPITGATIGIEKRFLEFTNY